MANLDRCDPFGDSFEESFRRIFAPARRELPGAPTDIKVDVRETEQARAVKAEIAGTTPRATRVTVRQRASGRAAPQERRTSSEGTSMASFALRTGRRSFLLAACAAGAATVAAVGARRPSLHADARAAQKPEGRGYQLSDHNRKYYRSTLV